MILAITYGDENFTLSSHYNLKTAIRHGKADRTKFYGPDSLEEEFKSRNADILKEKRGAGYWLWKPYVVNRAMEEIGPGDYLAYADSGSFYVGDVHQVIEFMRREGTDLFLGKLSHLEGAYSKRDAFVYMDADGMGLENTEQYEASFLLVKKTDSTEKMIREWLYYAEDRRIISDDDNVCGKKNYDGFIQNRYDQTILSLLAKKYGHAGYRAVDAPSRTGEESYPQIVVRTRFRNCSVAKFYIKIALKYLEYATKGKFRLLK